jgi:hypothetical protein
MTLGYKLYEIFALTLNEFHVFLSYNISDGKSSLNTLNHSGNSTQHLLNVNELEVQICLPVCTAV